MIIVCFETISPYLEGFRVKCWSFNLDVEDVGRLKHASFVFSWRAEEQIAFHLNMLFHIHELLIHKYDLNHVYL